MYNTQCMLPQKRATYLQAHLNCICPRHWYNLILYLAGKTGQRLKVSLVVGPPSPPLLWLPASVNELSTDTQFPHAQLAQSELQVFGNLASLGQDLSQPLFWCLGKLEVADSGVMLVLDPATSCGWEISLCGHCDVIVTRVQQTPEVPIKSWKKIWVLFKWDRLRWLFCFYPSYAYLVDSFNYSE